MLCRSRPFERRRYPRGCCSAARRASWFCCWGESLAGLIRSHASAVLVAKEDTAAQLFNSSAGEALCRFALRLALLSGWMCNFAGERCPTSGLASWRCPIGKSSDWLPFILRPGVAVSCQTCKVGVLIFVKRRLLAVGDCRRSAVVEMKTLRERSSPSSSTQQSGTRRRRTCEVPSSK